MIKKEYITPDVKVVKLNQHIMLGTSGLDDDFGGYSGESNEDDDAD
ncbi:MAG: hypothetical protein IJV10_05225 [Prevotella sp.]|nr:hypothetical protein [Prevotella sp.]